MCCEAIPETMKCLEDFVREGARRMLQVDLEAEVEEYINRCKHLVDHEGKRLVVKNGTMPECALLIGAGPVAIKRTRVDDRGLEKLGKES